MSKKVGAKRIPGLVSMAWQAANAGNEQEARRRWAQAIELGYEPDPGIAKQFEKRIAREGDHR
jgi:hypothetical protein